MKLGKALIVAAAGAVLLAFTAPADAQWHGRGGISGAAWHGRPGWGWHGHPWGWRGHVAFVGGFYGYPYWGWGYPYGYPPYGYGYYAYPPPQYYSGAQEKIYEGHIARSQGDSKDFSGPNQ